MCGGGGGILWHSETKIIENFVQCLIQPAVIYKTAVVNCIQLDFAIVL